MSGTCEDVMLHVHKGASDWLLRLSKTIDRTCTPIFQASRVDDSTKDQALVHSKTRKEARHILDLPKEIQFNILILLSPKVLHEVVRCVCKEWNDIVSDPNFVETHRELSSTGGFLLQQEYQVFYANYIEGDTRELKETKIDLPFRSHVKGSRNGLVLLLDMTGNINVFHVVNPITKAKISLPPLYRFARGTCFAVTSSGHYKVVNITGERSKDAQMRVFTVGIDKAWRTIDLQGMHIGTANILSCRPFVTDEKWVYWYSVSRFFGFTLNVDDETVYQFHKPEDFIYTLHRSRFIHPETGLGVVQPEVDTWKFWELIDVISGKWTKVTEIHNMKAAISRVDESLYPANGRVTCPLRFVNGYLWFSRHVHLDSGVVRYNVVDKSFKLVMIRDCFPSVLHPHVPTLFSPKNC